MKSHDGYLTDKNKSKCFGCEACAQACPKKAITIHEDDEGFRYPYMDSKVCIGCDLCHRVCPYENMPDKYDERKYVFGGYSKNPEIRFKSTSGGAFTAILDTFCDKDYVIFGAESKEFIVWHSYVTNKEEATKFRKSKYSQSKMGESYQQVARFLREGKKVLFSGTPCQIAGLRSYLRNIDASNLLTVEVICEGVPSPLYIRKYGQYFEQRGLHIDNIDYRYKGKSLLGNAKWDFEIMKIEVSENTLDNGRKKTKMIKHDRWFNPFWNIWLSHLMSRPACYDCAFTTVNRVADISLGDLWGVHLYCPELYGKNGGASLIIGNTQKGIQVVRQAQEQMYGHELDFKKALKYQSPLRKHISYNDNRILFMEDLKSDMSYEQVNRKWAKKPDIKLLWNKYIWGNRQNVWLWNLMKNARTPST